MNSADYVMLYVFAVPLAFGSFWLLAQVFRDRGSEPADRYSPFKEQEKNLRERLNECAIRESRQEKRHRDRRRATARAVAKAVLPDLFNVEEVERLPLWVAKRLGYERKEENDG